MFVIISRCYNTQIPLSVCSLGDGFITVSRWVLVRCYCRAKVLCTCRKGECSKKALYVAKVYANGIQRFLPTDEQITAHRQLPSTLTQEGTVRIWTPTKPIKPTRGKWNSPTKLLFRLDSLFAIQELHKTKTSDFYEHRCRYRNKGVRVSPALIPCCNLALVLDIVKMGSVHE